MAGGPIFMEDPVVHTCLVIVSVKVRNVIDTSKFRAQFVEVASEFPKLLAQSGRRQKTIYPEWAAPQNYLSIGIGIPW